MNKLIHHTRAFFKQNASTILTCVGSLGVIATAVTAAVETPKAMRLLEQAKEEKGAELSKLETVAIAGPIYIPAVVIGLATITCIFGANVLNKRQQAALMSAYALLDNSYKEYRGKLIDLYGEETDAHIKQEIMKDKFKEIDRDITDDKRLFFDDFSGRYYESTIEQVQRAEYLLNREVALYGYACLNQYYELLDVPAITGGNEIGWSAGELQHSSWSVWIDFHHTQTLIDDDLECYIVQMSHEPTVDYLDY